MLPPTLHKGKGVWGWYGCWLGGPHSQGIWDMNPAWPSHRGNDPEGPPLKVGGRDVLQPSHDCFYLLPRAASCRSLCVQACSKI